MPKKSDLPTAQEWTDGIRTQLEDRIRYLIARLAPVIDETAEDAEESAMEVADLLANYIMSRDDNRAVAAMAKAAPMFLDEDGAVPVEWWNTKMGWRAAQLGWNDQPDLHSIRQIDAARMLGILDTTVAAMLWREEIPHGDKPNNIDRDFVLARIARITRGM